MYANGEYFFKVEKWNKSDMDYLHPFVKQNLLQWDKSFKKKFFLNY